MQKVITVTESKSIRKKLMAATSMLLVAVIMLVSATYAWFTLSTAPEVKGITTTVGANGNLEMALATTDTWGDTDPRTGTSDSMVVEGKNVHDANITWGNLVDVSDNTIYGLDLITLYPAALNATTTNNVTKVNTSNPLSIPVYGYDGRIAELSSDAAIFGLYSTESKGFLADEAGATPSRGVRAIGTSSSMTERQLTYRGALGKISTAMGTAQTAARGSLVTNGGGLTNIILKYANEADAATFGQTEVAVLDAMVTELKVSVDEIKKGLSSAVLGYAASAAGETAGIDETKLAGIETVLNSDYTVSQDGKTLTAADGTTTIDLSTYGDLATLYKEFYELDTAVSTAATEITALKSAGDSIAWAEFSAPLRRLVDTDKVTVNNKTVTEIKADKNAFAVQVAADGAINVQLATGAGAYADIADFCDDYSAGIDMTGVVYDGLDLSAFKANILTKTTVTPVYLSAASQAVKTAAAPTSTGSGDAAITDFYGYAIDMLFRTNAADSNLMLQISERQRVYEDSENTATQGAGSSMTFSSTELTDDNIKDLMDAMCVVFMDKDGNVLSEARLDTDNATAPAGGIKADLKLVKEYDAATGKPVFEAVTEDGSQVLTGLAQNTKTNVTVLVYLDGNVVDNSMVAALADVNISMNLQFSSSATLLPMENSALMQGSIEE